MYSLDRQLFEEGDARKRMIEYGKLVDRLDIVVLTGRGKKDEQLSGNTMLYPTNSWHKFFRLCDAFRLGKKIIREQACGLVVAQEPYLTGWVACRLANKFKLKLLVSAYGNNIFDPLWQSENWKHRIFKIIGQKVFRRADAIQTDGDETVADLKKRYGEKVFWKPIVPSNIEDFKIEKEKTAPPIKVLFVGRLVKQKNLPLLISVMEKIKNSEIKNKVMFTLIGDGPLRKYLLTEIKERGLTDLVDYSPRVSREEMVKIFTDHHLLILTSIYEGFAKVFMEAAATGLPIVTTQVSGVANVVKDTVSGFVVSQGDAQGLAEKLEVLATDPGKLKEFSKKIKEDFWSKYSPQTTLEIQKNIFYYLGP